jgi:hypothetical protein
LILKELSMPIHVPVLGSLLRRINPSHPKIAHLQADLAKYLRGYRGEKAVSYYLDFLPEKENYIFHSLRLPSGPYSFQIDYLILTNRYALILECKNFFGTLYFDDDFKQMIRIANENEEGFQDPISQAKWHQHQLRTFLKFLHISLPIDYFVVIGDPSTIVKTSPKYREALKKVVHGHSLLEKIADVDKSFEKEVLNAKDIRKLSKLLLKNHTPEEFNPLKRYGISREEISTGIRCLNCKSSPMIRQKRTWFCPKCGWKDRNAHISALEDYFHLMGSTITNKQFREFVHLESESIAKRLLGAQNLSILGLNKGRVYSRTDKL